MERPEVKSGHKPLERHEAESVKRVTVMLPADYFKEQPGDAEKIASVRARLVSGRA